MWDFNLCIHSKFWVALQVNRHKLRLKIDLIAILLRSIRIREEMSIERATSYKNEEYCTEIEFLGLFNHVPTLALPHLQFLLDDNLRSSTKLKRKFLHIPYSFGIAIEKREGQSERGKLWMRHARLGGVNGGASLWGWVSRITCLEHN